MCAPLISTIATWLMHGCLNCSQSTGIILFMIYFPFGDVSVWLFFQLSCTSEEYSVHSFTEQCQNTWQQQQDRKTMMKNGAWASWPHTYTVSSVISYQLLVFTLFQPLQTVWRLQYEITNLEHFADFAKLVLFCMKSGRRHLSDIPFAKRTFYSKRWKEYCTGQTGGNRRAHRAKRVLYWFRTILSIPEQTFKHKALD